MIEQSLTKAVGVHRARVADNSGHQTRDDFDQRHRRDLTATEDVIADRPFLVDLQFDPACIDFSGQGIRGLPRDIGKPAITEVSN